MFIMQFESFSHTPYRDRSQFTHGYGTKSAKRICISEYGAELEALDAIEKHFAVVDRLPNLDEAKRAALTSFSYNVGQGAFRNSNLYRLVKRGNLCEARKEFKKWIYVSGRPLKGLAKRRSVERELFSHGLDC